jgi:Tol biopolymer transport system component/DNA-binding winged helix-turn-helix (wHTH) protein
MSTKPEQQLKVGDWWYLPEQDKLVKLTETGEIAQTAELDNLCQKALNYFMLNAGRLVTRDELLNDVWGVRDVSDGRISRVIRVLRVELGDDSREPTYIETIPKRGFRFVATVTVVGKSASEVVVPEILNEGALDSTEMVVKKRSLSFYVAWSAFAAIVCCSFIYIGWLNWAANQNPTQDTPFGRLEPISSMDGLEFYPSTSLDGRYLAYSHSKDLDSSSAIVVQDLQTLEKRVLKKSDQSNLIGPVWHPEGNAIAYQQLKRKISCEIRLIKFDSKFENITDERLTSCGANSMGARMSWAPDGRFLVYPDWQEKSNNIALMLYPVDGGKIEQLTMPPETSLGDFAAAFSPNGKQLAFIRDVAGAAGQIWLMNFSDRSSQMLVQPQGIYPGQVTWFPDQPAILYPSGNNELSKFNIETRLASVFAYTDNKAGEVTMNSQGRIFASVGKLWQSSIRRMNNPLKNTQVTDEIMQQANRSEGMLELNPVADGPTAVMSNRSGVQQVWLYFKDGRQKQISRFSGDFIPKSLEFSPDGKYLLVLVGTSVWLLSENEPPVLISKPGQDSRDPSWSYDSQTIYFSTSEKGRWQIIEMERHSLQQKTFAVDMDYFRESPDGAYQVWRSTEDKLMRLKLKANGEQFLLPLPAQSDFVSPSLVLRQSAIYFLNPTDSKQYEICSFNLADKQIYKTGIIHPKLARRFSVSSDEQFILQDDGKTGDIDVAELVFTKQTL